MKTFNQKTCEWYLAEQIACNICKPYASLDLVKIDANTFNLRGRLPEVIYWFLQCNSRLTFWLKIFLSELTLCACVAVIFRHGYWRSFPIQISLDLVEVIGSQRNNRMMLFYIWTCQFTLIYSYSTSIIRYRDDFVLYDSCRNAWIHQEKLTGSRRPDYQILMIIMFYHGILDKTIDL